MVPPDTFCGNEVGFRPSVREGVIATPPYRLDSPPRGSFTSLWKQIVWHSCLTVTQSLVHGLKLNTVSSLGEGQLLTSTTLSWTVIMVCLIWTMVQLMALWYMSTATQTVPLDLRVRSVNVVPSLPPVLGDVGLNLVCLEFLNSSIYSEVGIHLGSVWEGLAVFPEPYEALSSWPARDDEFGCDRGDIDEPKTPEARSGISESGTPVRTPVVSVRDKNPACPCFFTQFNWILGLIEHLKRTYGLKKIFLKFSKCGK